MEHSSEIVLDRLALGIQQPWAELILSGRKQLEIRSTNTRVRGTIYLYASRTLSTHDAASMIFDEHPQWRNDLPRGVLIGTAQLVTCRPALRSDSAAACLTAEHLEGRFAWELRSPERLSPPIAVKFLPYGVWFYPFQRRSRREP